MNKNEVEELIEKAIGKIVEELKKERLVTQHTYSTFSKTEMLLYNYPKFKKVLEEKIENYKYIKKYGIQRKSKDIARYGNSGGTETGYPEGLKLEEDEVAQLLETEHQQITYIRSCVRRIDNALESVADDTYFDIIPMKYFEGLSYDAIAIKLNCNATTVGRQKNNLINKLKVELFPTETIRELIN